MNDKVTKIIKELKRLFPKTTTALNYSNPWELLVAVILSAQTTDKQVNKVTENLFKKYKKLDDYVNADPKEFVTDIKSVLFHNNKAKNILASAKIIKDIYKGKMPDNMEDMIGLPGVARKTANIVLYLTYGKIEGIAVDTHVRRLSQLYGLTKNNDPVKIEQDLMKIIPRKEWMNFSFRMIDYGRAYCPAKKHDHANCPLVKVLSS